MWSQRIRHDLAIEQNNDIFSSGETPPLNTHTHTHTHTFTCTGLVYSNPVTSIKGPTIVVQSSISHLEEACQVCSGYFSFLSLISHLKQMVISSGYPCLCVGKKPSKPMTLKRYFVYVCVCNLRLGRTSLSLFYLASPKIA